MTAFSDTDMNFLTILYRLNKIEKRLEIMEGPANQSDVATKAFLDRFGVATGGSAKKENEVESAYLDDLEARLKAEMEANGYRVDDESVAPGDQSIRIIEDETDGGAVALCNSLV